MRQYAPLAIRSRWLAAAVATLSLLLPATWPGVARAVTLADSPLFATITVPGNLILDLSVEWPTATTPAYPSTVAYSAGSTYYGYFDPEKCYRYSYNSGTPSSSYFYPVSAASSHACTSTATLPLWSGNYMNWASMQTLDAFRWVLTGGYRSVDTASSTILTKTYAGYNSGVMPQKAVTGSSVTAGATPMNWDTVATRVRNLGTRMWITGSASDGNLTGNGTTGVTAYEGHNSYVDSHSSKYARSSTTYEVYINVKVCDVGVGVESNCVKYSSTNYKPEGLMQSYSQKLRYAVFGYYNHSATDRNGGVLRARMKYVGPTKPVPGSSSITNSAAEWSATDGTLLTNPDSDDASSAVSFAASAGWSVSLNASGAMNYLNQFGYTDKTYKSYDPVSELYYAALRYFRNLGNVSSYSSLAGAGNSATAAFWFDGFPVIPTWEDPIQYACQKNFILGIGDVNTWYDAGLPGSSVTGGETIASEVNADSATKNVTTSTNMVGQLEGYGGSLGGIYHTNSRKDTYYIAGLAYDAHTTDIRSDLSGTQTVNTYWMDVLESQVYMHKNQYWLAAKYGGFDVPNGFDPWSSSNGTSTIATTAWYNNTDTLTVGQAGLSYTTDSGSVDKRPDNYFPGNRPELMKSGLTAAFSKIASEAAAATSTATSVAGRRATSTGNLSYAASYNPADWSGNVVASTLSYGSDGAVTTEAVWDARALLAAQSPSARYIVTCCTTTGAGLRFDFDTLKGTALHARTLFSSFSSVPGVSSTSQSAQNFVAYLRGDRATELQGGGAYRNRKYVLGDIVGSKVNAVAAPGATYADTYNSGYGDFKKAYASRKTVVYVGANDGMMHAFDGSISGTGKGSELFAYIPSFTYGDTSNTSDRYFATYGLASLGNPSFTHHFFVNSTPLSFDVDMANTEGSTASGNDWRTILVGGMGKGGKGYYAIDVTDPSSWTSESEVAGKVLWEFTDPRMGYSFGEPHVVKIAKYGWVVLLSSGYNNSDGVGYLFIVNPRTGALIEAIATTEGKTASPINLSEIRAFINDYADYTADAIYAGDLQGNVWRFDLTGKPSAYPSPTKLAKLTNAAGDTQPITTKPLIGVDGSTKKRYVMIGTGQLLSDEDILTKSLQAFYAIVDGTSDVGGFYTSETIPNPYTLPVARSDLSAVTDLLNGLGKDASPMGWYLDFANNASGIAERMNVDGDVARTAVAFSANLPNGDACNPAGTGRYFVVSFPSAKSVLLDSLGNQVASITDTQGAITEVAFQSVDGNVQLLAGDSGGNALGSQVSQEQPALKRLSWREISTVQ